MPSSGDAKGEGMTLAERLHGGAKRFACLAAQDFLESEWEAFYVHAGTSVELLSKACLAKFSPVLVADGRSFDSLLHASGNGRHAKRGMRTINVREAVERCGRLMPAVSNLSDDLNILIEARNGTIHGGVLAASDPERALAPFLRVAREMLREIDVEESDFWGEYHGMVVERLKESANAAAISATDKMTAARLAYEARYGHLNEEALSVVASAMLASLSPSSDEEQLSVCPVCDMPVLVIGSTEVDWEPEVDWADGEAWVTGVSPIITFHPGLLACSACGLELNGEDELAAADASEPWQPDDIDPSDYYDEAPDPDDW